MKSTLIVSVAAALLLAVPVSSQVVVVPSEGAFGTAVTVTGTGLGTKKPKVFLTQEGSKKKRALKVTSSSNTMVVAELRKVPAGTYTFNVDPAGKNTPAQTALANFIVRVPEVLSVNQVTASLGDEVEITGRFFGTKKGRVKFAGKPAKVLEWEAGAISEGGGTDRALLRLTKSKKAFNGPQPFEIKTKSGTSFDGATVTMTGGSQFPFTALVDGKSFVSSNKANLGLPGYNIDGLGGTQFFGAKKKTGLTIVLPTFDPSAAEGLVLPATFEDAIFMYNEGVGPKAKLWQLPIVFPGEGAPSFVTITAIGPDGLVSGFGQTLGLPGFTQNVIGTTKDITNISFSVGEQPGS